MPTDWDPEWIYGVDFAADERAGERLWMARGAVREDALHLQDCQLATERLTVAPARHSVLPALTDYLAGVEDGAAIGTDAPFGLPQAVVSEPTWEQFLLQFPSWVCSPTELRRRCAARASLAGRSEARPLRRATDEPLSALSPYGDRLCTRTFHALRDVVRPLVLSGAVGAAPMCSTKSDTLLLETYPAATMEELGHDRAAYEGSGEDSQKRRGTYLDTLEREGVVVPDRVRERITRDETGHALESAFSAFVAYRNTRDPENLTVESDDERAVEGHIYV